jgi:hypothetical protein
MSELIRPADMQFDLIWCPPWKIELLLSFRKLLVDRFISGSQYTSCISIYPDCEEHEVEWLPEYIYKMADRVDESIMSICDNLNIEKSTIIDCLNYKTDSFFVIKMHLIIQELLWLYLQKKLGRLPKMHENWHFSQILDFSRSV